MHSENEIVYLYLDDIIPNRFQPREIFDDRALQELAMSIKEHGVIQPIIVRQIGEKYEIIAGERRYKASAIAGLTKIPAIVRNLDDKESSKVALLENLQRKDLNSIEEARTYQKILELDQMTQEELAKTMGKSQSAIANKLRLLTLPEEIQDSLLKEKISERHARSLLSLNNPQEQIQMMHKVIDNRMTVRELDNEIKMVKNPSDMNFSNSPANNNEPINYDNLLNDVNQVVPVVEENNTIKSSQEKYPRVKADLDYLLNLTEEPKKVSLEEQFENKVNTISIEENPPIEEYQRMIDPVLRNEKNYAASISDTDFIPDIVVDNEIDDVEQLFPEESGNSFVNMTSSTNENTLDLAISTFKSAIQTLKNNGYIVSTEETNTDNLYQITIQINKDE